MNKFRINISLKTFLIIQGVLVAALIPMDIFLGEIRLDYVLPLYGIAWIMAYSDLSKKEAEEVSAAK